MESLREARSKQKVYKMTAFIPVLNHRTYVEQNCSNSNSDGEDSDDEPHCGCLEITKKYNISVDQFTFIILDSELNDEQKEMFEDELQNSKFTRTNASCLPKKLEHLINGLTRMNDEYDHNLHLFSWKLELV